MFDDVIEDLAKYSSDPLGFVYWAFSWGEGELREYPDGPEQWQQDILTLLGEGLITIDQAIQIAVKSGHGIGKSALVSWIILWAMSTFEDTRGVVTANTENQLKTKTWVEVATWYRRFIAKEMFKMTATALFSSDPAHERTWRIDMVPWSEKNTEAFAGMHNQGKRILVVFDEASAINDLIWEVTEGALTDKNTQIIWCCFGNPTKNSGRFRACFEGGKFEKRWITLTVDSRTVSFTNKTQIAAWIEDYGEDSDFVRYRVKGMFPRQDENSFISLEVAREAENRSIYPDKSLPIIIGVDVARFGTNNTVIYARQGRNARDLPILLFNGLDTMEVAAEIIKLFNQLNAAMVFIDEGGVGGGVLDRCRQLRLPCRGVHFGGSPSGTNIERGVKYKNKRAEMYGEMRDWLQDGAIPKRIRGMEIDFAEELSGPAYTMSEKDEIVLERKETMARRGLESPDVADALALTFAYPVASRGSNQSSTVASSYDPFAKERITA
jgi:hypothetical protein